MSLIPLGITALAALAQNLLNPVIVRSRRIGPFVADLTVDEHATDELAITEHPVEQGADITDHSYKRPARVTIRCGYSNSSTRALGNPHYVDSVYSEFLRLQVERQPFDVLTGKRVYRNMLMARLSCSTDEKTENALEMVVECQQVIIVQTQTLTVPSAASMKTPEVNGATQNLGVRSTQPGTNFVTPQ